MTREQLDSSGIEQANVKGIEEIVLREQRDRDDAKAYIGGLLVRQRQVNHEVFSFAGGLLRPGSVIVDACAGPEGSILAAATNGYTWIGNDVSTKFARNLHKTGADKVTLSDFSQAPFKSGFADGVAFVFALNNILRPEEAVAEAARITKPDGKVIVADPGPTRWVTSILLYSLLGEKSRNILTGVKYEELQKFFPRREYTADEYADSFIENRLGSKRSELEEIIVSLLSDGEISAKNRKRKGFKFHEKVVEMFYGHLQTLLEEQNFVLVRAGVMGVAQVSPEKGWDVASPVAVNVNEWKKELEELRISPDPFPENIQSSQHRLIFPILCFSKGSNVPLVTR